MPHAAIHNVDRLLALSESGLLERAGHDSLDRLVRLTCRLLDVQVALVSLVLEDRQVFAGHCGLPEPWSSLGETPLSHSFCQHVVSGRSPLVIRDARADPLVRHNRAVDDLNVVAYLGVPLVAPQGHVIGALCAIDGEARDWSDDDVAALMDLSLSATNEILLRHELTRRAAAEAANQLLVDELNHRIRNLFTLVHDLVRDETAQTSVPEFQQTLAQRIRALVDAHSAVFENTAEDSALGDDTDLAEIAASVLEPIPCSRRIRCVGEPVALSSRQALYAALLLHELAMNALKHGALSVKGGAVNLTWYRVGREVHFDWIERNGPPVSPPERAGFGSTLIDVVTAGTARKDAKRAFVQEGLECRLAMRIR